MSRAEELRAELACVEAEEVFAAAKAKRVAGDLKDKAWEKAKQDVTRERLRLRLIQGRPGADNYRLDDDGTVVSLKERTRRTNVRNDKGEIVDRVEESYTEEVTV